MARKRIGELLVERGMVSAEQLQQGLLRQRQTRQRLGITLVQLGIVNEEQLAQVLSEALGIPLVDLRTVRVDPPALRLLRPRFCELHDLFPYQVDTERGRKQLLLAVADPLNVSALEEAAFTTGYKIIAKVAALSGIRAAILRHYHRVAPDESTSGRMVLIARGGGSREVDTETHPGFQLEPAEPKPPPFVPKAASPASPPPATELSKDLSFLFGEEDVPTPHEELERKFWALLRVMTRKGLITMEELNEELAKKS